MSRDPSLVLTWAGLDVYMVCTRAVGRPSQQGGLMTEKTVRLEEPQITTYDRDELIDQDCLAAQSS